MEPKTIILMGPQGSGKGTQSKQIVEVLSERDPERQIETFQTGALFRDFMAEGSWAGKRVEENLSKGVWPDLFLSVALWASEFNRRNNPDAHNVLDGFPRTRDEARMLESALHFFERKDVYVIVIETPREISRERMRARKRADDTEESIEFRLDVYYKETTDAIAYFDEQDIFQVHRVNGDQSIEEVHSDIKSALNI